MDPQKLSVNLYYDMNYDPTHAYPAAFRAAFYAETICCWGASTRAMPRGFDVEQFLDLVEAKVILPSGNEDWWDDRHERPAPQPAWDERDLALRRAATARGGVVKRALYWPETLSTAHEMAALFENSALREETLHKGGRLHHVEAEEAWEAGNWDLLFEVICRTFISDWLVMRQLTPKLKSKAPLSIGQNFERYYELTNCFLKTGNGAVLVKPARFTPDSYLSVIDSFLANITARKYIDIVAYRKDGADELAREWLNWEIWLAHLRSKEKAEFLARIYESDRAELAKRITATRAISAFAGLATRAIPSAIRIAEPEPGLATGDRKAAGILAKVVDESAIAGIVRNATSRLAEKLLVLGSQHRDWIYFLQKHARRQRLD